MKDKIMSLEEAVGLVKDGDLIGIGGLSFWRKAAATTREIIRQKKKDLGVLSFVGGFCEDQLIGAGCANRVRTSFIGMELFGLAPNHRRAVESGQIKVYEETEATIALGLKAIYLKVPFLPLRGILETDILKVREDLREFNDPITGDKLVACPPIQVDVAIIHVPYADEKGNGNIQGPVWMDDDLSKTAKKTILTCEKIVETEDIIHLQGKGQIPMQSVDAVVKVPYGAHPTSCYPFYTFDANAIMKYIESCQTPEGYKQYEADFINLPSQGDYLEKIGGIKEILKVLL
ncbi:MAG: CoA transferase subunit A [Candidatus Helarchaeota archaeon]|nr:CoA transferase subunit A [Candidatus Helarchaeota archaeon]